MKKELKILLIASALTSLAGGLFGPIYAVFVQEIGGDLLTAGGAFSIFSIIAGVMIYFISQWEDRVKHQERLIVAGYALGSLGYLGYLFVQSPMHLFGVQVILGVATAVGTGAYDGVYSRNMDKGKFASEWGMWEAMYYIVVGISALAGGILADAYGFKALFMIMFIVSVLGTIASAFLVGKDKKRRRK